MVPSANVQELIVKGEFDHALNLAALMLLVAKHGPGMFGLGKIL